VYVISQNSWDHTRVQVERTKLSRKVLYHFAIFAIVNELLVIKNRTIYHISPLYYKHGNGYMQRVAGVPVKNNFLHA